MTQPMDTAYVDIVPVDGSQKKFVRSVDKTMDDAEKKITKHLQSIDKDFNETFDEIDAHFKKTSTEIQKGFEDIADTAADTFKEIEKDVDVSTTRMRRSIGKVGDDADSSFRTIRRRFGEPMRDILSTLGTLTVQLGSSLVDLAKGVGGVTSSHPLLVLVLALTPAILALAAALSQLIGLVGFLPSGIALLITAILPLVVAFQNFGEAVSAVAEGDVEKIDEALKKLSPSAQLVAKEIGKMLPVLRDFQRAVQESFFSQIVGDFTRFGTIVLPAVRTGFQRVSAAFGESLGLLTDWLTKASTLKDLEVIFGGTASAIRLLTPPFITFLGALTSIAAHLEPLVTKLTGKFGDMITRFSGFIERSIADGSFDKFVDEALVTLGELVDLVKVTVGLFGTIFGALEGEGHSLIQTLTQVIKGLDEFFQTEDGKLALDALVFAVKALGYAIVATLDGFIFFTQMLRRTIVGVGMLITGIRDAAVAFWDWLTTLRDGLINFITSIPERISSFLSTMFDNILQAVGIGIGLILYALQVLPQKIADFLVSLPERAYNAFLSISQVVLDLLTGAVDAGKKFLIDSFNGIVDFVKSVPERLKSLIPDFNKAGSNLIQSFMNGFRSVGTFIGDVAGDIVKSVKGFLNRAIDKINSGIATIDNVLPGDLGRIPRLASGALVRRSPGGTAAIIGEGREDEAVLPLSKLEAMIKGGEQITFGPGAIQVVFEGVVPTEGQARSTGAAVAKGLLDAMARQRLQMSVRAG